MIGTFEKSIPQGLKPEGVFDSFGPTEVVPLLQGFWFVGVNSIFRSRSGSQFSGMHGGAEVLWSCQWLFLGDNLMRVEREGAG